LNQFRVDEQSIDVFFTKNQSQMQDQILQIQIIIVVSDKSRITAEDGQPS